MSMVDVASLSKSSYSEKLEVVYSCIRDKSETAGSIPLVLYGTNGKKKTSGRDFNLYTKNPNDYMTMQTFVELAVYWLEYRGVFYAYKAKNTNGNVHSIIPFRFQDCVVPQMDLNGNVYYTYTTNDGKPAVNYALDDLFIIKGQTRDGYTPISPLAEAASLIKTTASQEENYSELQKNGITSQMALATDNLFTDVNKIAKLQEDWKSFRGNQGFGNIPVFENGLKPVALKLTPQESELLRSREFSVNRICRVFRVPIHRVGITERADISNIFDLDEAYFRNSVVPILRKIESGLACCLSEGNRLEFNLNAFYSGSPWRMAEAVDKLVKGGLYSVGEGREVLGLERIDGDDVFAIDNNNVMYGRWDNLEEMQRILYEQQNKQPNKPDEKVSEDGK